MTATGALPIDVARNADSVVARPRTVRDAELDQLDAIWRRPAGIWGWLTTTDHKEIGLRIILTAMTFFSMAGLLAVMMRIQLALPENHFLTADTYNQFFTTHGTAMMFLFAVPIMQGVGIYVVPLMLGTRNVAFPKLLNFSYWCYFIAGCALFLGLFCNMGPDMGWFSYLPLAGPGYSPGHRMDLWSQMVSLMEVSSLSQAVVIITTILKQRTVGMSLNRMPLFVWTQFVTAWMIIFAMPAVMLCSTLMSLDRLPHIGTHIYNPAEGGDVLLWQHLFWFFAHPEVYIIFIPATGFVSMMIETYCRRRMFGYLAMVLSTTATAFIGFGVWVHHMFATPLPQLGEGLFTASSLMIVIPNSVQMFCWIATIWSGKMTLKVPMFFVLGFIVIFIIGGFTGVILASVQLDRQVTDTMFVVAHLHYVLIGGAVFPLFGVFHHWFPKWTGRMYNERLGQLCFAMLFIGFNMTFWPMHNLGLHGMTRRIYTYLPDTGWAPMNRLATVGAFILGLGVLVMFINFFISRRRGEIATSDPWLAGTLEWATSSPPPPYNFAKLPTVRSREPLWNDPPDTPVIDGLSMTKREVLVTTAFDAVPDHRFALGSESIVPVMLALFTGFFWLGGGIFDPHYAIYGAIGIAIFLFIWFWRSTASKEKPHKRQTRNRTSQASS